MALSIFSGSPDTSSGASTKSFCQLNSVSTTMLGETVFVTFAVSALSGRFHPVMTKGRLLPAAQVTMSR